jgi:hypothetical protein
MKADEGKQDQITNFLGGKRQGNFDRRYMKADEGRQDQITEFFEEGKRQGNFDRRYMKADEGRQDQITEFSKLLIFLGGKRQGEGFAQQARLAG